MATKNKQAQEALPTAPDWILAIVGISIVAWFLYSFPVMEILSLFFTLVVVPVVFLLSICMGGMGLYSVVTRSWNGSIDSIKTRVAEKMQAA